MINMTFEVKYSERAINDLDEIIGYISDKLFGPKSAEKFYEAVKEKLELLSEYPYMYPLYHDDKLRSEGYRFAVIGNYLMFYLVDDDSSIVNIARILYRKLDTPSSFG